MPTPEEQSLNEAAELERKQKLSLALLIYDTQRNLIGDLQSRRRLGINVYFSACATKANPYGFTFSQSENSETQPVAIDLTAVFKRLETKCSTAEAHKIALNIAKNVAHATAIGAPPPLKPKPAAPATVKEVAAPSSGQNPVVTARLRALPLVPKEF